MEGYLNNNQSSDIFYPNERPQGLNTVLKHQIDELSEELTLYKEKYSLSEIEKLRTENLLWDLINKSKKVVRRYTYM